MPSDSDYEDGEILEEGEEPEERTAVPASSATSSAVQSASAPATAALGGSLEPRNAPLPSDPPSAHRRSAPPLQPTPSANPRKRLHSELQERPRHGAEASYDTRTPLSHRQPMRSNSDRNGSFRREPAPYEAQDDRVYSEELIIKYPRQQPSSRVLLDFATWMATARMRKRLDMDDVQQLVVNALRFGGSSSHEGAISPYLMPSLVPGAAQLPAKVCVVLLARLHPSVLQKYRAKLSFFDACSSVPVMLAKRELHQMRRSEAPLPELLYKFPRPTVDTRELSADELFYAHELTFLMKHSIGYMDELVFLPTGTFTRKSQPLGGTWELDGDLLHLKWRQHTAKSAAGVDADSTAQDVKMQEEEDDAYTLDVLVSEDGNMHEFSTDPVTDEAYAHKVPEHLASKKRRQGDDKPRTIRLTLAKATAMEVPRSVDGTLLYRGKRHQNGSSKQQQEAASTEAVDTNAMQEEPPLEAEAFTCYTLSLAEMRQHGYPMDVEEEQRQLEEATEGNTRDRYVATKPRPTVTAAALADDDQTEDMDTDEPVKETSSQEAGGAFAYALDCEMCETDLGMELTRVTVVDIQGAIVYDQLVKPQSTIINYHTEFSGISEETLRHTKCILADVQRDLLTRFLFTDTLLVGHSLTSDLRALRIVHLKIADTAILYPHQRGFPFRTSLKYLTKTFLKKDIQMKVQAGHDSAEDAIAAMDLLVLKVREGPWFGIPESSSSSGAFDSMLDKTLGLEKKMAMLRLQCVDKADDKPNVTEEGAEDASSDVERKPWDLFASGDLKAHSQSPFRHAQSMKTSSSSSSAPASAQALTKVEECSSWETLKTSLQDALETPQEAADLCWVEIEPPSASAAQCNDFVAQHERWMAQQLAHCEAVDAFLLQVRDQVLPEGTLLLVLPQGDLSLLRYLKGLRTRSKWRDATAGSDELGSPEELHAAVGDAFRGVMDSCLFLTQK
ncbi:hypothetical protein BBJ28_00018413 [Nothophytophthora sp. Chile5]|nr:hypothetical protein BBJ28_00018413 [Nothophytophthora sp. Chile5]